MTADMPKILLVIRGMMSIGFGIILTFNMTGFRFSKKYNILMGTLFFSFSMSANYILLGEFGYNELSKLMIILVTTWLPFVVLLVYLSKDNFFKCLFNLGVMFGIFATIYWISSLLIFLFQGELLIDILVRSVFYVLTLLIFQRYIKKRYRLFVGTINRYWGLISSTAILFALFLAMQLDLSTIYFDMHAYICLAFTSLLMLLMYVIAFLTFQNTHDLMMKTQAEQNMKLQITLQKEQYYTMQSKIEMDRAFRHDLRHHANLLAGMLTGGNLEEALKYVQKLGTYAHDRLSVSYCENMVVNTILIYYVERARETGLMVECKAVIPEKINIDEMELCTVLSNLLENAVEHGGGMSPQLIISILQNKGQLVIRIQNSFDGNAKQDENGHYCSIKQHGGGIGLRSVESIVRRHNGTMNVSHTKNDFTVDIAM